MSYVPSSSSSRAESSADYAKPKPGMHIGNGTQKRHDWKVMYNALVQFGIEKGHCNVPLRHSRVKVNDEDSVHLGAWLATQRREHLNGKMKPERLALLQSLVDEGKLEWAPMNHSKQSEQTWPVMFECLRMYCEERQLENPGVEVSSIPENRKWIHPDGHEVGLGRWMHTQNKQRRAGKLRPDRCAKMQELVDAGVFRWPTQRQFKAGGGPEGAGTGGGRSQNSGDGGYYSDDYDGMSADEQPPPPVSKRAAAAAAAAATTSSVSAPAGIATSSTNFSVDFSGSISSSSTGMGVLGAVASVGFGSGLTIDDDARAKKRARTSLANGDYKAYFSEGDKIMQPTHRKTSIRGSLSDYNAAGDLELDYDNSNSDNAALNNLLSAAKEVGVEQLLKFTETRSTQMLHENTVREVRMMRDMMQHVGADQEPLILRNHSLDLEPGSTADGSLHYFSTSVVGDAAFASSVESATRFGFENPPPLPLTLLAMHELRSRNKGDGAGTDGTTDGESVYSEAASGFVPTSLGNPLSDSLLTPEIRMHLQAQVIAHIKASNGHATATPFNLSVLAHVAEEEHLSRANSADSSDGLGVVVGRTVSQDEMFAQQNISLSPQSRDVFFAQQSVDLSCQSRDMLFAQQSMDLSCQSRDVLFFTQMQGISAGTGELTSPRSKSPVLH